MGEQEKRLQAVRKALALSKEELAESLSISVEELVLMENGTIPLPESVKRNLCWRYQVNYVWFTGEYEEMFLSDLEKERLELSILFDTVIMDFSAEELVNARKMIRHISKEHKKALFSRVSPVECTTT